MGNYSLHHNASVFFVAVAAAVILSLFLLTSVMTALPFPGSRVSSRTGPGSGSGGSSAVVSPQGMNQTQTPTPSSSPNNTTSSNRSSSPPLISAEGGPCGNETVLEIFGETQTGYIRTAVAEAYQNGIWTMNPTANAINYDGGYIPQNHAVYSTKSNSSVIIKVTSAWPSGFIPTLLYSNQITFPQPMPGEYYPSENLFSVNSGFSDAYMDVFTHYSFNEDLLRSDPVAINCSSIYLTVPDSLKPTLNDVLAKIDFTQASSDYDKVTDIANYLRANYIYDLNYTRAPVGQDPVQWFLMSEKRGVCANFNSAFVLLLRQAGIPARIVAGYAISSSADYQEVIGMQAHEWAEVLFKDLGWVEFDATGSGYMPWPTPTPSPSQPTSVSITNLQPSALRGETFSVEGKVTDSSGSPVNGLEVTIQMKVQKSDAIGYVCGFGTTNADGVFDIVCQIPSTIKLGDYQIIADAHHNGVYMDSESDPVLQVNAQSRISVSPPAPVSEGQTFRLEAWLNASDTGEPITNAQLVLSYTINSQSKQTLATTDSSGFTTLYSETIPETTEKTFNYTVTFNQSGYYLGSQASGEITITQSSKPQATAQPSPTNPSKGTRSDFLSSPLFLVILAGVCVSVACAGVLFYRRKEKPSKAEPKPDLSGAIAGSVILEAKNDRNIALRIFFPFIQSPFPDVWGVNEIFKAQFCLSENDTPLQGTLEVQFGNDPVVKITTNSAGMAEVNFRSGIKGVYPVIAKYSPAGQRELLVRRPLRIVEYTEEIVSIFKETFEFERSQGAPINQETTPREFQHAVLQSFVVENPASLDNLVSIFEYADYSLYILGRSDYEKMFLASLSVKQASKDKLRCD